jgi:hypothetical protein
MEATHRIRRFFALLIEFPLPLSKILLSEGEGKRLAKIAENKESRKWKRGG